MSPPLRKTTSHWGDAWPDSTRRGVSHGGRAPPQARTQSEPAEMPPHPEGLPPGGALSQEEIKTLLKDGNGKNAAA